MEIDQEKKPPPSSSTSSDDLNRSGKCVKTKGGTLFKCLICLDVLSEPIVTRCGHMYCWPCIDAWMKAGSNLCPLCKGVITPHDCIPVYASVSENSGDDGSDHLKTEQSEKDQLHFENSCDRDSASNRSKRPNSQRRDPSREPSNDFRILRDMLRYLFNPPPRRSREHHHTRASAEDDS